MEPDEFLKRICSIEGFRKKLQKQKMNFESEDVDYPAFFRLYREYLMTELGVKPNIMNTHLGSDQAYLNRLGTGTILDDEQHHLMSSLTKNPLFLESFRLRAPELAERLERESKGDLTRVEEGFALDIIRRFYFPWIRNELASTKVQLTTVEHRLLFRAKRREKVKSYYQDKLKEQLESARKAKLEPGKDDSSAKSKPVLPDPMDAARSGFLKVEAKHLDLHRDVMKTVKDKTSEVRDLENRIASKRKQLEVLGKEGLRLSFELDKDSERLKDLEAKRDRLNQMKARLEGERAERREKIEGHEKKPIPGFDVEQEGFRDFADQRALVELGTKIDGLTGEIKPLQRATENLKEELKRARMDLTTAQEELLSLNESYNVVWDEAKKAVHDHQELNRLHKSAEEELKWLESLGKNDHALNIYGSAANISYDFFLAIGNIVAGRGCGPLRSNPVGRLAVGAMGLVSHPLSCLAGVVADVDTLDNIYDYDTGQLSISLKLGLTWGVDVELAKLGGAKLEGTVGLALTYDAAIVVLDDRRFRVIHTLDLAATTGFEIPVIFNLELQADLIERKAMMDFTDVYHWAGWLCMRWAHAWATVRLQSLYDDDSQTLAPSRVTLDHLIERAQHTIDKDGKIKKMIDEVLPYLREPIIRTESLEGLTGYQATAALGCFKAGLGLDRWAKPKYRKRHWDESKKEEVEKAKKGHEGSASIPFSAGLAKCVISIGVVHEHSNPDLTGQCVAFNIAPQVPLQAWARWRSEWDEEIGKWVATDCLPVLPVSDTSESSFRGLFKSLNDNKSKILKNISTPLFGPIQINLQKSKAGNRSHWVLLYWRRLFNALNLNLGKSVPVGYGFNVVPGVSATLQRTYRDRMGTNTMIYLQTVYDGFMNPLRSSIPNPRPEDVRGDTLWKAWAKTQKDLLWRLMCNIAKGAWVAEELNQNMGGQKLVTTLTPLLSKADPSRKLESVDPVYDSAFSMLESYLAYYLREEYPSADRWENAKEEEKEKIRWSVNPFRDVREVLRHRSTQFKLEKEVAEAKRGLGHKRDLARQIETDVEWVPDSAVTRCPLCRIVFGLMTRKHHCRKCGNVICGNCSRHELPIRTREGKKEMARVCDACFNKTKSKGYTSRFESFSRKQRESKPQKATGSAEEPAAPSYCVLEGYERVNVQGDGNCFFRSIALAVGRGEEEHDTYRQMAVDHMRKHLKHFQGIDEAINHAYLNTMSQPAGNAGDKERWGGGPELDALSRALRCRIFLHQPGVSTAFEFAEANDKDFKPDPANREIHLCWESKNHYTWLRPI